MIYDSESLKNKYKEYSNINQKLCLEVKNKSLTRVKRGLYTDNLKIDAPIIANICYSPSYLSFEYALSYYGIIPEHVSVYTSATYSKKNNKRYIVNDEVFDYYSIPNEVFSKGIKFLVNENGIRYKIQK